MRMKIDGRVLVVKRTTRGLVELQRQTGWKLEEIDERAHQGYAGAIAAFMALNNAGFTPIFDDLLDRDVNDFEFVPEPGDERGQEVDVPDPQTSRADSDPGGDGEWPPATEG